MLDQQVKPESQSKAPVEGLDQSSGDHDEPDPETTQLTRKKCNKIVFICRIDVMSNSGCESHFDVLLKQVIMQRSPLLQLGLKYNKG